MDDELRTALSTLITDLETMAALAEANEQNAIRQENERMAHFHSGAAYAYRDGAKRIQALLEQRSSEA